MEVIQSIRFVLLERVDVATTAGKARVAIAQLNETGRSGSRALEQSVCVDAETVQVVVVVVVVVIKAKS